MELGRWCRLSGRSWLLQKKKDTKENKNISDGARQRTGALLFGGCWRKGGGGKRAGGTGGGTGGGRVRRGTTEIRATLHSGQQACCLLYSVRCPVVSDVAPAKTMPMVALHKTKLIPKPHYRYHTTLLVPSLISYTIITHSSSSGQKLAGGIVVDNYCQLVCVHMSERTISILRVGIKA